MAESSSTGPPDTLWHYTTAARLLQIVSGTSVFATSLQQLSDASEIRHAHALLSGFLREDVTQRFAALGGAYEAAYWSQLSKWLSGVIALPSVADDGDVDREGMVGTFSLSEHENQLSQWRGYGGDAGVAIGFSRQHLEKVPHATLRQCVYSEDRARQVFAPLRQRLLDELENHGAIQDYIGRSDFFAIAPTVKHKGFREEAEWRIITGRMRPSDFSIRSTGDRVVSYVPVSLVDEPQPGAEPFWGSVITHVVIGPSRHSELTRMALEPFMRRRHFADVFVSDIPFRAL